MNSLYQVLLPTEFILAVLVFGALLRIDAPYGKFLRRGWGPVIPARLAWFLQEFPAFAIVLILFLVSERSPGLMDFIFLFLWQVHYFHRTFIYPFRLGKGSRPYPVILVIFAIVFNLMNGFLNGYYLFMTGSYDPDWSADPRFIIGTMIFITGFAISKNADHLLRKLKSTRAEGYGIPRGGFFRWISSPHYFGEIVEWTGWAILTWSLPGLAFAIFTFANLAPRALSNHRWYLKEFKDYPRERKALIPHFW